jgi:hypothetical protein
MPIFRGRKPPKKRSFGGKPGGRFGKPGRSGGRFGKPGRPGGKKGKRRAPKRKKKPVKKAPAPSIDTTGMEGHYLKELIGYETPVVVVLNTGEKIRGIVRYYDRDVFSLGPADGGPKMFLRKENIRYLYEEPEEPEELEELEEPEESEEEE